MSSDTVWHSGYLYIGAPRRWAVARGWRCCVWPALGLLLAWSLPCQSQLTATEAYIRGLPPGQATTAAYMILHNNAAQPLRILSASSPLAGRVEFHLHSHEDGVMRMRRQDVLLVPAHGSLPLVPGQLHLMLFDLQRPLRDGEQIALRLCAEGGDCTDLQVPVVSVLRE